MSITTVQVFINLLRGYQEEADLGLNEHHQIQQVILSPDNQPRVP